MMKGLRIQNTTGEPIEIVDISFTMKKDGQVIKAGEEIGLRNEYFYVLFREELDELEVQIKYKQDEIEHTSNQSIKLITYKNKNEYTTVIAE